jgi:hypothetical protein
MKLTKFAKPNRSFDVLIDWVCLMSMTLADRVELFRFLFLTNEMTSFINNVTIWSRSIQSSVPSLDDLRNCLFQQTFSIDYVSLSRHSDVLASFFLQDLQQFEQVLIKIIFRLVRKIAGAVTSTDSLSLDINQLRIKIRPTGLPLDLGIPEKNGLLLIGSHCFASGRVTQVDPVQPIVIRYLYKCRHGDCRHMSYRKPKDRFGAIHCRRCGELAQEDETGRITINARCLFLKTDCFGADPIEVVVKGGMCRLPFRLGQCLDLLGTVSLKPYRINANCIGTTIMRKMIAPLPPTFRAIFDELTNVAQTIHPPLIRVLFLAVCATIIRKSALIVVRNSEGLEIVTKLLEIAFGNLLKTFYPTKSLVTTKSGLPPLLSCEDGIVLVPRYDMQSSANRDKFARSILDKSVGGWPLKSAVICIGVSPALDGSGPCEFDFICRIDSLPEPVFEDFLFGALPHIETERLCHRVKEAISRYEEVAIADEEIEAIGSSYASYRSRIDAPIRDESVFELASAVCAFRCDKNVSEIDVLLSIYFLEEKWSAITGDSSTLTQLPKAQAFSEPTISAMRTMDEDTLFQCWVIQARKLISE